MNSVQNAFSTDSQGGFVCYATAGAQRWLASEDVRRALHVPSYVQPWAPCNGTINAVYKQLHNDTQPVFDAIIASKHKLRILIYNGDTDLG